MISLFQIEQYYPEKLSGFKKNILREYLQYKILEIIFNSKIANKLSFLGGTALRIVHENTRFSEDLDFLLKAPGRNFQIEKYLHGLFREFSAYGYRLEVVDRDDEKSAVQKIFLKDDSLGKILHLKHIRQDRSMAKIRIKLEVDTNPPAGGNVEVKYLAFPFAADVACQDEASLFAGKLHALLCREYVKGRDWYDLLFYSARRTMPNLVFFSQVL